MKSFLIWLLLCSIWGTTWIAIKIGLADVPPFGFAALRFVIAPAVLFVVIKIFFPQRSLWPRRRADWAILALAGFLSFSLNYGCVFWGEQRVTAGLAALLGATSGPWMLVIGHFALQGERLTPTRIAGVFLALAGVAIIFASTLRIDTLNVFYGCCAGSIASPRSSAGAALC